ncbi:hypothetical protein GCM10010399_65040 [Dactylosporangium fulvum]|uniref:Leucine-rich repeat domain-containing protein n=1 Tax=Dactylosporangium fulvum TaxID=53359 RepID=A0ABY5VN55_9ACTN|nr:hypothetical protein [Dactylosporangium fulvum]UWP78880.1 hypothetical protein Dfulv_27320 [Dactylosporangium fulvum]
MPETLVLRVRLNRSYDGHPPRPGEVRYPGDSAWRRAAELSRCDPETAVSELWRDGRVPEWVNLAVAGRTGTATVVEVVCCGRFTDDDARLYHAEEGTPPFHVVSPILPPQYDGTPFSVHAGAECWGRADLDDLTAVADRVRSFDLMTDEFDGESLAAVPDLPRLEVFRHRVCTLRADALSAFARFPGLRTLSLYLADSRAFHAGAGGRQLPALTHVALTGLPSRPWDHAILAEAAPAVSTLSLGAAQTLWLDGTWSPSVRSLNLEAADVAGSTLLPAQLDRLRVNLTAGTDEMVAGLLVGVTELDSLSLRGTPVTDAIVPLIDRLGLRHVDLAGTAVSTATVHRFRPAPPGTTVYDEAGITVLKHPTT